MATDRTELSIGIYSRLLKPFFDRLVAVALLPVLAIVTVIVAVAIKLDDRGPVFYKSARLGVGMVPYKMYKFRSMTVGAPDLRSEDGRTLNSPTDPRLTRVGRVIRNYSIDELPQIINVLRGEMSMIGPRPSPLGNEARYSEEYLAKFAVKPGITGYSQSLRRNEGSLRQRQEEDLFYVQNLSLRLDLLVIMRTVSVLANRSGVYNDSQGSR